MTPLLFALALVVCGPAAAETQTCETVVRPAGYELNACLQEAAREIAAGRAESAVCRRMEEVMVEQTLKASVGCLASEGQVRERGCADESAAAPGLRDGGPEWPVYQPSPRRFLEARNG